MPRREDANENGREILRVPLINPTRNQWIGGALVVGAAAAVTAAYVVIEGGEAKPSGPPRPLPEPIPIPPPPPQGGGGPQGGVTCDLGPSYPGFAWDGVDCAPTEATPPGIYIVDECSDFLFVDGDDGPQPDDLESRILAAAQSVSESQDGLGVSYIPVSDPTTIVTEFLSTFWPECTWPPTLDASDRIVQLFMALSVLVGRFIVDAGGNSLGATTMADVDEAVGTRLVELGFEEFTPEIVPEIDLTPPAEEPPPPPPEDGGGGGIIEPPPPGPGFLDLPDGGVLPPSQQPGACSHVPIIGEQSHVLPLVDWTTGHTQEYELFRLPDDPCTQYSIDVGICFWPNVGPGDDPGFGALFDYLGPPVDFGIGFFGITPQGGAEMDWNELVPPLTFRQRTRLRVQRLGNGNLSIVTKVPVPQSSAGAIEACPDRDTQWPPLKYRVTEIDGTERAWDPLPRISFRVSGTRLFVNVTYSGLPQFIAGNQIGTGGRALSESAPTGFMFAFKSHATGL